MNCGTFQIQRIAAAVADVMKTFEDKSCASCGNGLNILQLTSDAYHCPACGAAVCVVCGCTDQYACEGGCSWAGPGFCSTHVRQLDEALARHGVPRLIVV